MKFKPFKMAQISAHFVRETDTKPLVNMHSSNPQPFTWNELQQLLNIDFNESIKTGSLAYTSTQGDVELRGLISEQNHTDAIGSNDVILTSGAQEGIFLVMNALLEQNDHVVCFTPCFEPLSQVSKQLGAKVSEIPLNPNDQWRIDWERLETTLDHQTKLLVINFPHNPTGSHITAHELERLIQICKKYNCYLFSDEVFRGLEHHENTRLPAAADLYDKAISMGVMSKSLALPGIRLGWLTSKDHTLNQSILTIKSHLSICQSSIDTQVCKTLIPHSKTLWRRSVDIITKNKNHIEKRLSKHPNLSWHTPCASATGFIQINNQNADDYCLEMAKKHGIFLMPNKAFLSQDQAFRLTLGAANSEQLLAQILSFN